MRDIVEKLEFGCPFKPGTIGEKDSELAEVVMQEGAEEIRKLRARITELTQCDPSWYDMSVADAFRMWKADREELVMLRAEEERLKGEVDNLSHNSLKALLQTGCTCQGCGGKYITDVSVPDKWWERIKPEGKAEGAGLLCPQCIVDRLLAENERLKEEVGDMRRHCTLLASWHDLKGEVTRLIKERDDAVSALTRCRNEALEEAEMELRLGRTMINFCHEPNAVRALEWAIEDIRALKTSPLRQTGAAKELQDGEPCGHPGCASHISHPCEGCGRIGARNALKTSPT